MIQSVACSILHLQCCTRKLLLVVTYFVQWSFGVTCWEIFSISMTPYPGIHPTTLIAQLENGERLPKPNNAACCNSMYVSRLHRLKYTHHRLIRIACLAQVVTCLYLCYLHVYIYTDHCIYIIDMHTSYDLTLHAWHTIGPPATLL